MYTINYNGYTLSNTSQSSIEYFDGLSRVETRISQDYVTGADGGNIWERKLGMRVITLRGTFMATDFTTYYSLRAAFQRAFMISVGSSLLTITKSDGTQRYIYAKVVDIPKFDEASGEAMQCVYEVVLKAENPYYTDIIASGSVAPVAPGGTPVAMPVPTPIGGGNGGSLTITNIGDVTTNLRFDIQGTIQNPRITNTLTGESFQILTTVPAGSTLSVYYDQSGLNVVLGGANYMAYLSGTVFKLAVGSANIVINGASYDASALLTVSFLNQYIAL